MEDELKRLLAERKIERLLFDYAYHLDMNHPGEMAKLFVDDCEVSYAPNFGATGIEAYKKTLEGIGTFFTGTSHHVSNVVVDFTSDTEATVRAVVLAVHRYVKERPDGWLFGQYDDVVVLQGRAVEVQEARPQDDDDHDVPREGVQPDRPRPVKTYEHVRIDSGGDGASLTWLVLNRPDRANALSAAMLEEISDALEALKHRGWTGHRHPRRGQGLLRGDGSRSGRRRARRLHPPKAEGRRGRRSGRRSRAPPEATSSAGWPSGTIPNRSSPRCTGTASPSPRSSASSPISPSSPTTRRSASRPSRIGGGYLAPVWSTLVGPKRAKELAFVAGNTIDGPTAVEWGWANHSVPADKLIETVEALAARIAQVPPDVLRIKKLSINRSAEAQGFREALAHVAEMDALLHLSPSVLALKKRVSEVGLKDVIAEYRGPSTKQIVEAARLSSGTATKEKS